MRNLCLLLLVILTVYVSPVAADVKTIGDFGRLDNWTGLAVSRQQTPDGDVSASLVVPGIATFEYTEPKTYLGWETPTFADMLDEICVEDWFEYRHVEFQVMLPDDRAFEIECTIYPLQIGRPDYMESLSSKAVVKGKGWQKVLLSLRDFDYKHHQGLFWRFIQGVSITGAFTEGSKDGEVFISQMRLKKGKLLSLSSPVKSKPVKPGQTAVYEVSVTNESNQPRQVTLLLEETAWEACPAELSQTQMVLAPWESQKVSLTVTMTERVAVGGRERRKVTAIPDARADLKEDIHFITVRYRPHPYLLHTDAGWKEVKKKAQTCEWAKRARQSYIDSAHGWRVPKIGKGHYCYALNQARNVANCAIAWKLSGDETLAAKVIKFLRDFTEPKTGYPSKLRSNSGTHVHQGMFFVQVARAYDLLYDRLTPQDHERMEQTMRLYSHWVNPDILTGDGNNHQVSIVGGALLNSLAMQDFAEVQRYLYGAGGYLDLMGTGILDDGNYFEGTANYNVLVANVGNSIAIAFEPWGMDVKNWKIPPKYGKYVMVSDWAMRGHFLGMSFERQGPANRNYRQLKDLWDTVLLMSDYRGVVFPTGDSVAIDLTGGHDDSGFELAYYLWRDPAYVPVIRKIKKRSLLYGVPELPEVADSLGQDSYYSDSVGFVVLRSKAQEPRQRIQAVQRYGTHGGYHGHFDRTSLASLSRFGRSHYGTEASWYGYGSFMFKMWVQTSDSHNMVVVDHRMQQPNDNKRLLFHTGELMQVSAIEIETPWIDPPYGGQTPYKMTMPQEKSWLEGRWLPTPENPRPQGDTGTPTEPVLQRRLVIVTDDYVVMSDYLKGKDEHDFDNLFNCKGLVTLEADQKDFIKHTSQCDANPYSSAQFITDCDWYQTTAPVKASFVLDWSKGDMGGRQSHSEPGIMNVDYYSIWPPQAQLMTANYPETLNVARHLYYTVKGDGLMLAQGKLATWILGKVEIDVDVVSMETLEIETRIEKAKSLKTVFMGNPHIVTTRGKEIMLDNQDFVTVNIASVTKANKDYAGGKVTLFGDNYSRSIAAEPADRSRPGKIVIDLTGKKAARFKATLGGDYPVGGDDIHRKIIATRSTGTEACFLSVIELHENSPVIRSAKAVSNDKVVIERTDGRVETIKIKALDGDGSDISVEITVEKNGRLISSEKTLHTKKQD